MVNQLLTILGFQQNGKTYQEAVNNAEIIIQEWIETAQQLGREIIPQPKERLM